MKGLRVVAVTLVVFLALGVASVYANPDGNLGLPILGTTGAPALAAPSLFSGAISVLYADGTPVVLQTNQITLDVCGAISNQTAARTQTNFIFTNQTYGCASVNAMLKQTAPGTYTYSFTPPTTIAGTVTIYIVANGLADDNGRVFPSVDTSIGTYAFAPSTTTGTSASPAGTPLPSLTRQAVNTSQTPTTQASPVEALLLTLSALTVAGCLLVIPKRH
jgi:hypothetical protein